MGTLFIKHVPAPAGASDSAPHFLVARPDGKAAAPVRIEPPVGYPVAGRPLSDLVQELRWYLETFLEYPFPPNTDRAAHVLDALRAWGRGAFAALFTTREAVQLFEHAVRDEHHRLLVQVWSDDAAILGWPWEGLVDPQVGFLAQTSAFERRLNRVRDPDAVPAGLPRDRLNILLVTARPYAQDVHFRSISRPLIDLIAKHRLAAHVHVLRPPTFERLREHLRERPGFYHVLHFDGHGAYGGRPGDDMEGGAHRFQGAEGRLVFEDAQGAPDPVTTETLSVLLREHAVAAVVLNACQSAMLDARAADPFASVATGLVRAGARSVVAMAYSLYVSAAQEFLPAFYRRLFETGSTAEAVRAGRQQMLGQKKRDCVRGKFDLEDWLVPVLYEQDPLDFSFASTPIAPAADDAGSLPDEAVDRDDPVGFVGRDGDLLALERALRGDAAAIVIHGLGGVGKTTLARGLVAWLQATDGLGLGCVWFSFQEIRSAEFVLNRLGDSLFGGQFSVMPSLDQKIDMLAPALKARRLIIVWDNFEVVAGVAGAPGTLSADDRAVLVSLLRGMRGGASKVIITSRSDEAWLDMQRRVVPLGGLQGEERWSYCDRVLEQLGIRINRDDEAFAELVELLGGHPLAIRAILPHLEQRTAASVASTLRTNVTQLGGAGGEAQSKLFATLRFVEQSLPEALRPLLVPLALHERFVDADYLEVMAKTAPGAWSRRQIDEFCHALGGAGLLRDRGQSIHEMHPALTGYLRVTVLGDGAADTTAAWTRAFVGFMAEYANRLAPKELHEQRFGFHVHGASFYRALGEAGRLGLGAEEGALTQALAAYAQHTRAFREAHDLFLRLAEQQSRQGSAEGEAGAYHQLGISAQEQRDFAAAEQWYRKSLAIEEKQGNEHGAAITYHQLGISAQEQRDFAAAEQWYRKSLAIKEKQGNEHGAASTYHQLGISAQEQRDFAAAEQWYRKSLAIEEKQGNEHGAAITYHQLGISAQEQRDFAAAEQWYRKSLAIEEKQGDEHGAASTYHQLGRIAQEQRDFAAAEQWYRKSLAIEEKQGNEHGAAITYHQLGISAQEQRDFAAAEQWYRKSLAIKEKQGNEHGAASTYGQLGNLRTATGAHLSAGDAFVEAMRRFVEVRDGYNASRIPHNFSRLANGAPADVRKQLEDLWREAGFGELPAP